MIIKYLCQTIHLDKFWDTNIFSTQQDPAFDLLPRMHLVKTNFFAYALLAR